MTAVTALWEASLTAHADEVWVINQRTHKIQILDGTSLQVVGEITAGQKPHNLTFSKDAKTAYVAHSPLLVRQGFRGRVYCTQATRDFCEILLPDCGYLQEEEAEYANRHSYSKHRPALPLYTRADAERCLSSLFALDYGHEVQLRDGLKFKLVRAGHILGASQVAIEHAGTRLLFSGDLGRLNDPIMVPPAPPVDADYLVLESTYGDRLHDTADPKMKLGEIINRTCSRGGTLVIPAFAVGRAQQLMYYISVLKHERAIPDIPVFLNSPMAADVTVLYRKYHAEHRLEGAACDAMCRAAKIINTVEESKWLNTRTFPMVIISASGMATGGRVLHHLRAFAPDPKNTILFAGFQAAGTRGAAMLGGAKEIKIHGQYIPVRAEVSIIESLSAHADYAEIISWAKGFRSPPRQTFITHGEPLASDALRHRLTEQLGWNCRVPEHLETQKLS